MAAINYDMTGQVFDIQRFSLNDGPGVRTIVFLKGCPLSCWWCANPESQRRNPVVMYNESDCIFCRRCEEACTRRAVWFVDGVRHFDYDACTGCGKCAAACLPRALIMKGEEMVLGDLIEVLKKDRSIFRTSGGGVTLSGGDPLFQFAFAKELLMACKAQGWTTAIETEGCIDTGRIEEVSPYLDTVLFDIKHIDPVKHKQFTGVSNEVILKNARSLSDLRPIVIRVPVVPFVNYSEEEIGAIVDFAKTLKHVDYIHLLPYHSLGEKKYKMMGIDYKMKRFQANSLTIEELEVFRPIVENAGFTCRLGDE